MRREVFDIWNGVPTRYSDAIKFLAICILSGANDVHEQKQVDLEWKGSVVVR